MKQAEVRFNGGDIEVDTSMLDYEGEHRLLCWVHILICMYFKAQEDMAKGIRNYYVVNILLYGY